MGQHARHSMRARPGAVSPTHLVPIGVAVLASELAQIPAAINPAIIDEATVHNLQVGANLLPLQSRTGSSTSVL